MIHSFIHSFITDSLRTRDDVHRWFPAAPSGVYSLWLDGSKAEPKQFCCDQQTANGGWTLVWSFT